MKKHKHWLFSLFGEFYTWTLVAWIFWVVFLDNNNVKVVFNNRMEMKKLEKERDILLEKIVLKKKERSEVFGNSKLLEKWAREKYFMRRPNEEVYVIVDENNNLVESTKEE